MKPILRATSTSFLAISLLGCVDVKIPARYQVDAKVETDLPKAASNLEPVAKAIDPVDIRGSRLAMADKDEQIRKQEERIRELETAEKRIPPAQPQPIPPPE